MQSDNIIFQLKNKIAALYAVNYHILELVLPAFV